MCTYMRSTDKTKLSTILLVSIITLVLISASSWPLSLEDAHAKTKKLTNQELQPSSPSSSSSLTPSASSCISYDSSTNLITITCASANLSEIDKQLNDVNILRKENKNDNSVLIIIMMTIILKSGC